MEHDWISSVTDAGYCDTERPAVCFFERSKEDHENPPIPIPCLLKFNLKFHEN